MSEPRLPGDMFKDYLSLEEQERARRTEQTYRRGYHQGYNEAAEDIFKLLLDDRMPTQEAYKLAALQTNLLAMWRIEETERFIVPPAFNRSTLQETLDLLRAVDEEARP
jgi:hypothetical protein